MGQGVAINRRQFVAASALGAVGLAAGLGRAPVAAAQAGEARFAYLGTYTKNPPGGGGTATPVGISACRVEPGTGALTVIQTVPSANPSFLALDPTQRFLFAINEIDDYGGGKAGSVESYAIDPQAGTLTLINRQSTVGPIPAHLAVDPGGRFLVIGNYVGGDFVALPIGADGRLGAATDRVQNTGAGPNTARQEAPHPHCVAYDPAGRFIATADLGIDKVQVFRLDTATGKLVAVAAAATPPGSGPRHLAFHTTGRFLHILNELDATITTYAYDAATGALGNLIQAISTVPANFVGTKSTAEIVVHPSGRFLYSSNRGQPDATLPEANAIVAFAVDQASGKLTLLGHTTAGIKYPRNFALDPTGTLLYACNQQADTVVQFAIDQASGTLAPTGRVLTTPTPVCLVFKSTVGMPGLPSTGAGGMAGQGAPFGAVGALGLGAAALALLARRAAANDAE